MPRRNRVELLRNVLPHFFCKRDGIFRPDCASGRAVPQPPRACPNFDYRTRRTRSIGKSLLSQGNWARTGEQRCVELRPLYLSELPRGRIVGSFRP